MITPDNEAAPKGVDHCVPIKALEIEGAAPAAGDSVEYTVRGKVARVEGGHVYVTPETVNEEVFTAPASAAEDDMMAAALQADADMEQLGG